MSTRLRNHAGVIGGRVSEGRIRRLVCIESPFKGDVRLNVLYADVAMRDAFWTHWEAPFLGHLLYPRVLNDTDPDERAAGIEAHCAWLLAAEYVAVYTDLGITSGMVEALKLCERMGRVVHVRSLGANWPKLAERLNPTPGFHAERRAAGTSRDRRRAP